MALLELRGISKSYPRTAGWLQWRSRESRVVDNVSFAIDGGETLGLVGESGSGKSTVARIALGLLPPTSGEAFFGGQSVTHASGAGLRRLRRRMQPVFQDPFAALNPRMTVAAILAEPGRIHRSAGLAPRSVGDLLGEVGMDASALPRFPHEFSGGQRQRINIARALALRPELLVLDEPLSALDVSVAAQIANLLRQLQRSLGLSYLFISHSMPLVRYLSARIAVMRAGRLVEVGESESICRQPRDPYTRLLVQATPGRIGERRPGRADG